VKVPLASLNECCLPQLTFLNVVALGVIAGTSKALRTAWVSCAVVCPVLGNVTVTMLSITVFAMPCTRCVDIGYSFGSQ
jgi:hypothetical protein